MPHKTIITMILALLTTIPAFAQDINSELKAAAQNGQSEEVQALLDSGADVDAKDENEMTALMWAAFGGDIDTVKVLLERGADVTAKDKDGGTARLWATTEIASLLKSYEVPLGLNKVDFKEVSFEIRGTGWQREETASGIILTRSEEQGRAQNLAVWPTSVPSSLRSMSQQEHISRYFEGERNLPRYEGRWEGFTEGEREILGHRYPTLSFRVVFPAQALIADGLFLLYFPQDFEERQRFYVLMWQDFHPTKQQGKGFGAFDAVVDSFQVRPVEAVGAAMVEDSEEAIEARRQRMEELFVLEEVRRLEVLEAHRQRIEESRRIQEELRRKMKQLP